MLRLIETYWEDVIFFKSHTLLDFFNLVKNLKYIPDAKGIEIIHRPKHTLKRNVKYRDCDDKSILLGSFLYMKKIPFRIVAVSNKPDKKIHHVLLQAIIKGQKVILDATYPRNKIFRYKPITKFTPISPWAVRRT